MAQCLLITFAFSGVSFATSRYVRAGATGTGTGSDWANAYSKLPSTLARGDVYYVGVGSYGSINLNDAVAGTSVITIIHAIVANHGTATGWNDSYAGQSTFTDVFFNKSYYMFDGATGGGPGSWESNFGFKVQMKVSGGQSAAMRFAPGVSQISIIHTDIQGRGANYTGGATDLLYIVDLYTNLTISYCFLHDADRTMLLTWPARGTGMTVEYSKFARNNAGAEHLEAWSAGAESNVIVRYNLFEDIFGTSAIAVINGSGDATNWDIYGNVFYHTGAFPGGGVNTGVILTRYDNAGAVNAIRAVNWNIVNNVIANIAGLSSTFQIAGPAVNCVVKNNMWYNNRTNAVGVQATASVDYNWFYNNIRPDNSSNIDSLSRSGVNDVIGTSNPFVNWQAGDWRLAYSIPGQVLASQFASDALGNIRGLDGTWDRGAYEVVGGSTPRPNPPNSLSAVVQ